MNRFFPPMDLHASLSSRARIFVTEMSVHGMPEALKGLKLAFASDFHLRSSMDPRRMADAVMDCRPDLILLGGDYADTHDQALRLFDAFRALRAPLGIFAVTGNNDIEAFGSHDALRQALAGFGARLLKDESVQIRTRGCALRIGGADEYKYGAPDYSRIFPDDAGGGPRILLSHYPVLPDAPEARMPEVILSGHTHGGQFNCLGLNPYSIGFERLGRDECAPALVSGRARFGRTELIVCKGIGTSRLHLRIGVKPEVLALSLLP